MNSNVEMFHLRLKAHLRNRIDAHLENRGATRARSLFIRKALATQLFIEEVKDGSNGEDEKDTLNAIYTLEKALARRAGRVVPQGENSTKGRSEEETE